MSLCHPAKDKGRLNPAIYLLNSLECFNMERKCSQNYHKICLNSISAMLLGFENSELSFKPNLFFHLSFHESAKQTLLISNVKTNLRLTNCHFYHINAGQGTHFTIRMQSHQLLIILASSIYYAHLSTLFVQLSQIHCWPSFCFSNT